MFCSLTSTKILCVGVRAESCDNDSKYFPFWRLLFFFQTLSKIASLLSFSPCVEIQFWCYSFRHRCPVASFCGCIGNIIFFCSWNSYIVFEWLDEGCDIALLPYIFHFAASDFKFFGTMLQNGFFSLSRQDPSGFGATIFIAVARSSTVFCDSISADPIVVAASRLLGAVAAFVILFFCSLISYIVLALLHEGCEMDLLENFVYLALVFFFVSRRF